MKHPKDIDIPDSSETPGEAPEAPVENVEPELPDTAAEEAVLPSVALRTLPHGEHGAAIIPPFKCGLDLLGDSESFENHPDGTRTAFPPTAVFDEPTEYEAGLYNLVTTLEAAEAAEKKWEEHEAAEALINETLSRRRAFAFRLMLISASASLVLAAIIIGGGF